MYKRQVWGIVGTVGSFAVTAAPWVSAGLSIASGILGAKAAREAGKEKARTYARKARGP